MSDDNYIVEKAEQLCSELGVRLTPKRKAILSILSKERSPLSAYEIANLYNTNTGENMAPMSVYRILDVLIDCNLVHKLDSTNKFLICSHIACEHSHKTPQFLICQNCRVVKEISLSSDVLDALKSSASQAGFNIGTKQIELLGDCGKCK